jgi:hypothetical protein
VVPSHLWLGSDPRLLLSITHLFTDLLTHSAEAAPFPRDDLQSLWDCKVTPAYCACQEGNTTGCISSNDGLGTGMVDLFSTRGIHGVFTKAGGQWPVASGQRRCAR